MDKFLLNAVKERMPKINPVIGNGLATVQLPGVMKYMDRLFRSMDYPEGMVYVDCQREDPRVKFQELTQVRDKKILELTPSDFFLCSFHFKYKGVPLYPKYLLLPYVGTAGIMRIRGKNFAIHPVMADKTFSLASNSVFKQFSRIKLTFERLIYHVRCNEVPTHSFVAWSWIHHQAHKRYSKRKSDKFTYSTLANYLFAEYGVRGTLKKFTNTEPIFGYEEVNSKEYPPDEWIVMRTSGIRPKAHKELVYEPTRLRVAIRKEEATPIVLSLLTAVFYLADTFPERITLEDLDEPLLWKIILGTIIVDEGASDGLIIKSVEDHIKSVQEYIDTMAREDFIEGGFDFETIYDVFIYVNELLTKTKVVDDSDISSLFGKQLVVIRYVLSDLVKEANVKIMYNARSLLAKKQDITIDDLKRQMNQLRVDQIGSLSSHNLHPEVTTVSTASDNYLIGITSEIVPQDKASTASSKSRVNLRDPAKHLHVSLAEAASYNVLPKSDPTGNNRVSPFIKLNERYEITRKEKFVELLDKTQRMISYNKE